jgi:hypothetical protein
VLLTGLAASLIVVARSAAAAVRETDDLLVVETQAPEFRTTRYPYGPPTTTNRFPREGEECALPGFCVKAHTGSEPPCKSTPFRESVVTEWSPPARIWHARHV